KLIETLAGERGQYVALSYCWGNHLAYTTTSDNLERHKKTISFSDIPRTLQDAMFLVRSLGLRYLWIDCLCIVQNDKADWEHEAARMADVYSNSYLTIAATRASHCDEGFLHLRRVKDRESIRFEDDEGTFELYFIKERKVRGKARNQQNEPLQRRGWTFQERLLASRILHFASQQTIWECPHMRENEGGFFRKPEEDSSLDKIAEFLLQDVFADANALGTNPWTYMINMYTSRTLKYPSDFFPALSGVLNTLQKSTGDFCYAGLWKTHFLEGLLWVVEDPDRSWRSSPNGLIPPKKPQKLSVWRAPSWSFASIEGTVSYESQFYPHG
ncbi:heterokaryon incompatibility protein-domain-containing protein, partial [Lophiotrema nucula]